MTARHFPPPWSAELQPNYYVVRDANGQQLAYVYYENEPGRRSAGKLLSKDEARRIAVNLARLPELLMAQPPLALTRINALSYDPSTKPTKCLQPTLQRWRPANTPS